MPGEVGLYEEDGVVLFLLVSANTAFIQLSSERFVYILFFYIIVFTVPGAFSQHKSHEANVCLENEQLKTDLYFTTAMHKISPYTVCTHTVARAQAEALRARKTLNYHI